MTEKATKPGEAGSGKQHAVWRTVLVSFGGWILALGLMVALAPSLWRRLDAYRSSRGAPAWEDVVESRRASLGKTPWLDSSPLRLFFGDSHVESGRWYDACAGKYAIRNCGLSMARIEDVTRLVTAVPDRNIDTALVWCGVNDLGRKRTVDACKSDYEVLLTTIERILQPRRTVVISVMPVRSTFAGGAELNASIARFNQLLERLCAERNATFVNLDRVVMQNGFLREAYSLDGLHLNEEGYQAVSSAICAALPGDHNPP